MLLVSSTTGDPTSYARGIAGCAFIGASLALGVAGLIAGIFSGWVAVMFYAWAGACVVGAYRISRRPEISALGMIALFGFASAAILLTYAFIAVESTFLAIPATLLILAGVATLLARRRLPQDQTRS